jgi:uncharacterized protein (TIGR03792 family)
MLEKGNRVVIEYLKFMVVPDLREKFVQQDDEIWTPLLSQSSGFLGKEVWISPDELSEVVVIIRWVSVDQWQAIPAAQLQETEAKFAEAMGDTYELVNSSAYQVRKMR